MKLENQDLLNEFFEKERASFPQVNYDQVKDIVSGPWNHLKKTMIDGELEEMRIKYFGNFIVYPKKAESSLAKLEVKYKEGVIVEKDYIRIKTMINKFLDESKSES